MNYTFLIQSLGRDRLKFDEPLSKHTYFKLGGPADLVYEARLVDELVGAVQAAVMYKVPYMIIGGGSNILVTDSGYHGLVIKNKTSNISLKGFAGGVEKGKLDLKEAIVNAESGVPANLLIRYTLDQGLSGLEHMLGLPGTVGGAVYNNSHHLGKLFGDHIIEVEVLDHEERSKYIKKDLKLIMITVFFTRPKKLFFLPLFSSREGIKMLCGKSQTRQLKDAPQHSR
jgi:UDP-N-acetylmuramate dehydrogenase